MKFIACPHCGGTDLKVMSKEDFERMFKERGCVSVECKNCSTQMFQHSVYREVCENYEYDVEQEREPLLSYEEGLKALAKKWNTRVFAIEDFYEV